jgi:O-antigen ligase
MLTWKWAGFLTAGSAMTFVRSALAVAGVQVVHYLYSTNRRTIALAIVLVFLCALVAITPARKVLIDGYEQFTKRSVLEFGSGRGIIFAAQIGGFISASPLDQVLGRGLHTVQDVIVSFAPEMDTGFARAYVRGEAVPAHNQFLRVLTEAGIVGLVSLAAVLFALTWTVWQLHKSLRDLEQRTFCLAVFGVLIAVLIYSLTITPLDSPHIASPMWFAVGVVFSLRDATPGVVDATSPPNRASNA